MLSNLVILFLDMISLIKEIPLWYWVGWSFMVYTVYNFFKKNEKFSVLEDFGVFCLSLFISLFWPAIFLGVSINFIGDTLFVYAFELMEFLAKKIKIFYGITKHFFNYIKKFEMPAK